MAVSEIHVITGVIADSAGRVLIAQRPEGKSLAGAWEFPGGKLKEGEDRFHGLARELEEELGIHVESARPMIRYRYSYSEFMVDLDVWQVTAWRGEPRGCENQALVWCEPELLLRTDLLPADAVIVSAIRLPPIILVTPPSALGGNEAFLDLLEMAVQAGDAGLICLRLPGLDVAALLDCAAGAACRIEGSDRRLLLHGDPRLLGPVLASPALAPRLAASIGGLHMPGRYLGRVHSRPVSESLWFGVSCHDADQLEAARALGADFAFLGPVKPTASHPGKPGMGWDTFASLVRELPLPVYAIGGLGPEDLETAWAAGAQGIAAIRSLWPG